MAVRRVCAITVTAVLVLAGAVAVALAVPSRDVAYRQALAGAGAPQILRSAFPGDLVTKLPARTIRVLVADNTNSVVIEGQTPLTLLDQGSGGQRTTVPEHHRVQLTPVIAAGVVTGITATDLDAVPATTMTMTGPVRLSTSTSLRLDRPVGLRFRGALQVRVGLRNTFSVINIVGTEGYTYGVLAGQIPATWGPRATQAMIAGAIAVRSRAVAQLAAPMSTTYDVTADTPLYLGVDGERTTTTSAAVKSSGKVLTHRRVVMNVGFVGLQPILFLPRPGHPDFVASGPARAIPGARAGLGPQAVALAKTMLGHPYVWGGTEPGGFDCSGLMYWIWLKHFGFQIPRVANDQSKVGAPVQRNDLQPGDLVFFADSSGYVTHVGMYIGNNMFLHAANPGAGVRIDSLSMGYFAQTYAGARRYSPSS
jgi:cell wall-associated NlpC family hydrolase